MEPSTEGTAMEFETPQQLLARLRLGREETFQRLTTCLILRGDYPRWNTRSVPSPQGLDFLRRLHELTVGCDWPGNDLLFVDELELLGRTDHETGGAPDWAVLWPDRTWLIELKTEKGSHRPGQVPLYFDLGHHHFPQGPVDLTYLTGPMDAPFTPNDPGDRYAHVTWADVEPLIREVWPTPTATGEAEVVAGLLDGIAHLHLKPSEWRTQVLSAMSTPPDVAPTSTEEPAVVTESEPVEAALELAWLTAQDGEQRALDHRAAGLDDLIALRVDVRSQLSASNDPALHHVVPWLWRWDSTGQPRTAAGQDTGWELRLSRYAKPQN